MTLKQLDRITFNSKIMAGQACIRGMRIPVSLILNLLANEKPIEEILGSSLLFMLNQQTRCQDNILLTQKFRKFLKP